MESGQIFQDKVKQILDKDREKIREALRLLKRKTMTECSAGMLFFVSLDNAEYRSFYRFSSALTDARLPKSNSRYLKEG
ncbi:hypothetical protein GCM10007422_12970 [Pedobacter zeae]|uniref:Uncharacterized protein n=1 Tax=Pedobacter zeae TaxID=1737356 RepID=A0A7W6K6Q8_9SPHI|nr:hypothetical protein [Pedobacter zeae]GGG99905.1 hypothetical protein GCM10007422_12970 [Pedobacter zeae]